jgi:catechol 2,3-dioxygenase-like lactoylglutathione lyase family enzyme
MHLSREAHPREETAMDQRLSLITLGVSDVSRAQAFYEALGWHLDGADALLAVTNLVPRSVVWGRPETWRHPVRAAQAGSQ